MSIRRITNSDLFVCIGKVLRPVGVEGAVKIQNYSDITDRYTSIQEIYIGPTTELAIPYRVDTVEYRGKDIVLQLEDHGNIEGVEHLRGYFCYLPRLEDEALDEDEFFVDELIGLTVENTDRVEIGQVKDIIQAPANDVLVINSQGDEILLPMVQEFIQEVNLGEGIVVVHPIEGLGGLT
ncbi:MAG: ribosome maturation factor RimM [Candidatus Marinimicrobia bacterium]|nr:ribosome maturation factor RimM [Candidatus Neomarinimicrobiota bacterium]MCF7829609.1 ribosome maturation factor RimM [Candidatus Neomarinimicrobiota bacterium]MCF7879769.1 ribosome maturation factor RimM [Candidatus Neomarinimicrobiota bacterium]